MGERLDLPALVGGQRIWSSGSSLSFSYEGGLEVTVPEVGIEQIRAALDRAPDLTQVSVDEITIFLNEVGNEWNKPDNEWRQLALKYGSRVTGYAADTIEKDVGFLGGVLSRPELYDMIETDFGTPYILDEWMPVQATYHRCWPKGVVSHIMVGNVPMAGLFTLVRSMLTKNVTIAKTSSRDVLIPQCFAQCMFETDPSHPLVQALSTLYWPSESPLEDVVLAASDVVTVWGQASAIESISRRVGWDTDVIAFGPKRSFALVLEDVDDWDRVGLWIGFDVCGYNQEACFSTQDVFVVGDPTPCVEALATWLENYRQSVPVVAIPIDAQVHVHRTRLEAMARGWSVRGPETTDWTVITSTSPEMLSEHPLGRCVFVHPIEAPQEVLQFVDRSVQTVSVEPFESVWTVADDLARLGADRIVPIGRSARMRSGFVHDGFHPMRRMVRWSAIERDTRFKYQFDFRTREAEDKAYSQWVRGQISFQERFRTDIYRETRVIAPTDV